MTRSRRHALGLGLGLVGLAAGWQIYGVREAAISFSPVPGAPGWEFGTAGAVSGLQGADLMTVGLDTGPKPLAAARLDEVVHRDRGEGVPVAVFSDFFCPYCRRLIGRLRNGGSEGVQMSMTWHELPLLGSGSVHAARAAEAAALQGGYAAFYDELLRAGFRPSDRWMGDVADAAGLDGPQLIADMNGAHVAGRLQDSAAAAARLGFFATPGLVVGKRAVLGALEAAQIADLVAAEAGG